MSEEQNEQGQQYKWPVIAAVAAVVILAGWFAYYSFHTQPLVDETLRGQFVWNFEIVPAAGAQATTTVVVLHVAGVDLPAGAYPGECDEINGRSVAYLPGELSGVICRNGASGTEIGVFKDSDKLVLKRGAITAADGRGADFAAITKQGV
ncbi:MAG TPA: hypothetical protein VHD55_01495 [Candidatus Paceibacterota bacterium]|nr:hypothetical protein [Candidatus Paceibacterota bacterium]